ncbi:MAG: hypothetical protein AAGA37_17855 [Actinomycetota bacterium]
MTTVEKVDFPPSAALTPFLRDLLGTDVTLTETAPPSPKDEAVMPHMTFFLDDDNYIVMKAAGDLPFVAYAGCALAMIPVGRAVETVNTGNLEEDIDECYREVMNVLTRTVNENSGKHVRLVPGMRPSEEQLIEVSAAIAYDVDVARYGTGRLCFWLT